MGQVHDGTPDQGRVREMLQEGRGGPFGKMRQVTRYVCDAKQQKQIEIDTHDQIDGLKANVVIGFKSDILWP